MTHSGHDDVLIYTWARPSYSYFLPRYRSVKTTHYKGPAYAGVNEYNIIPLMNYFLNKYLDLLFCFYFLHVAYVCELFPLLGVCCLSVRQSVHILQISPTSLKPQNQIFWNLVGMIYGIGFGKMKNMASVTKNWTYGTMQFLVYISKISKYRGASFKSVHS
jgi:hypothetical protein